MADTANLSRLESLQSDLNARRSIFHLAHAAISLLIAVISAGTAARLFYDYELNELPLLGAAVLVALGMFVHGFVRWALGRRALNREVAQFAELRELRATLGLDDPNLLLPR
ncbi:MAG: hypothetical protein IPJ65_19590 [Archangiaceae bacterium]|nr:hypothetical protein [Archangiaceae bacterium]